jgi:hypothetical protein
LRLKEQQLQTLPTRKIICLADAGQIVSEKVGKFLEKSENLSEVLGARIDNLNISGADVSDLKIKFTSYRSYLKSAKDMKKDADTIYKDENATKENLEEANNYMLQSIDDISKANKLLGDIFEELKKHENQKVKRADIENNSKTEFNNTKKVSSTNTN